MRIQVLGLPCADVDARAVLPFALVIDEMSEDDLDVTSMEALVQAVRDMGGRGVMAFTSTVEVA